MAIKKYYDSDCNLGVLDGKTVAVIGFGSQGHAHSENLAESGVNVVVGLRKGSAHWEKASEFAATHENFKVMEVEEAAKAGDVVAMLVPDELCAPTSITSRWLLRDDRGQRHWPLHTASTSTSRPSLLPRTWTLS